MKKLVCVKNYKLFKIGDITDFIPRSNIKTLNEDEQIGIYPVGAIWNKFDYEYIYFIDYIDHFCSLKNYRKRKLEKINDCKHI